MNRRLQHGALLAQMVVNLLEPLVSLGMCSRWQKPRQAKSAVRAVPVHVVRLAAVDAHQAVIGGAPHLRLPGSMSGAAQVPPVMTGMWASGRQLHSSPEEVLELVGK